jgi:hypothetical protein
MQALPLLSVRSLILARRLSQRGQLLQGMAAYSSNITTSNTAESLKLGLADELLSKLNDPTVLHTAGFIGGEWRLATSDATFQVRAVGVALEVSKAVAVQPWLAVSAQMREASYVCIALPVAC